MAPAVALVCAAAGGYVLGSIPWGVVLARLIAGVDPRTAGSKSTGATNAARVAGGGRRGRTVAIFAAVLALDAGKGVAAVLGARAALAGATALAPLVAGMAAIAGHCFSPWLGFRGGKGVAAGLGVFGVLAPLETAAGACAAAVTIAATRYVSIGSLAAACALPAVRIARDPAEAFGPGAPLTALLVATAGFVFWTHRANLARLAAGTENRLGTRRPEETSPR